MAKRLQKFGHRERDYDRPNRKWLCGHSVDGRECPLGPCAKGNCRGTGECLPIRKGDRWFCTRPESRGGECASGPGSQGQCGCSLAPCQPVRTVREWRRLAVFAAILITAGFLVAVLAGTPRDIALNPGSPTSAHAGEHLDCRSCHSETTLGELATAFDPHFLKNRAIANSELCLNCHGEEIGGWVESARFAHGWTNPEIQEHIAAAKPDEAPSLTDTQFAVLMASKGPLREEGIEGHLACATCHQEHHGPDYSLTELTNQQCQVCHQSPFHSFSEGHPTFAETGYPYARRTRIFFDHESHYGKHFAEDSGESIPGFDPENPLQSGASCRHCHQPDEKGQFMHLQGFEKSCAGCHEDSVKGGDPLTLLAIPGIEKEIAGGRWPASGYGLIPPMRWLLGKTESTEVAALAEEDEFGVVALNDPARKEVAAAVAADLRSLGLNAWREGNDALLARMKTNGFLNEEHSAAMLEGLSIDTVRAFLFPGIRWELGDLTFPALDLETLNQHLGDSRQRSIGLWPKGAASPLTPLMLHLLSHRPELDSNLATLRSLTDENGELHLGNLTTADERMLLAAEQVAWEIKALFANLSESGAPFLEQFETLRGGVLDLQDTGDVLERVFLTAKDDEAFMSQFEPELERYLKGQYPPPVKTIPKTSPPPSPSKGEDDDFGAGADDDFGDPKKPTAAGDDDFGQADPKPAEKPAADDDFGADEDFEAKPKKEAAPADDEFGDVPAEVVADEPKAETFKIFEPSPGDWQTTGGWFHENHAIHYASRGHADPVIKAWIDASVDALNSPDEPRRIAARRVLDHSLGFQDGVLSGVSGKCFKCHTVDRDSASDSYQVNWFGGFGTPAQRSASSDLTNFSHSKHFIALDCVRCHSMKESGDYADFFPARGSSEERSDPAQFTPNFHPIDKQTSCANCHQKSKSGDSCLQCHRYHSRKK